ncbi:MAG: hypothetical protein QXO67_03540 [Candidatus Bathyarchaeia archaeon]
MTDITEYGEIVLNGVDEWGKRRIDSLLEDGTKILIVAVPPPVVIHIVGEGLTWTIH